MRLFDVDDDDVDNTSNTFVYTHNDIVSLARMECIFSFHFTINDR